MDTLPSEITAKILAHFPLRKITILKRLNNNIRGVIEDYFRAPTFWDSTKIPTRILSYLPGIDVARFHRLSKSIRRIAVERRKYLTYPAIRLSIEGTERSLQFFVQRRRRRDVFCDVDFTNVDAVKVTPGEYGPQELLDPVGIPQHIFNRYLFHPFLQEDRPLQELFDFILNKADVSLTIGRNIDRDCIAALTESIQRSSAEIFRLSICPWGPAFSEICNLIVFAGMQGRLSTRFPQLRICGTRSKHFNENWESMRELNEVASPFRSAEISLGEDLVDDFAHQLSQDWRNNPFRTFFFEVRVKAVNMITNNTRYRHDDKITFTIDDDMKWLRMNNLRSREVQVFKRTAEDNNIAPIPTKRRQMMI